MTTTETTTRTVRIYTADNIYIHGLSKGPAAGWSLTGATLTHCSGHRITLTTTAADRITAALKTARPATCSKLTGYQVSQLPDAEAAEYTFDHVSDVHGIYLKSTPATPAEVELTSTDIVSVGR